MSKSTRRGMAFIECIGNLLPILAHGESGKVCYVTQSAECLIKLDGKLFRFELMPVSEEKNDDVTTT